MKTIKNKAEFVKRVSNAKAQELVATGEWCYVPKKALKKKGKA